MSDTQALEIIKQAVNVAVGSGIFKKEEDVILIYNSFLKVKSLIEGKEVNLTSEKPTESKDPENTNIGTQEGPGPSKEVVKKASKKTK